MISMQRSLSSPVCIHSSPPLSPTVTNTSSRSPTPSPDKHVPVRRPHRFTSRSPSRPVEDKMSLPVRRSDDLTRRPAASPVSGLTSPRKPVISQMPVLASLGAPNLPQEVSGRSGGSPDVLGTTTSPSKLPPPLIQDASLYSNPQVDPENDSTSLEELAHVVRLSKYQERKCANTRIRLQRSLVSTALSARFTRCGEIAHRNLTESFKGEDRTAFATLYNAIQDVRKSCDELRKYALLEADVETLHPLGIGSSESLETTHGSIQAPGVSFLHDISPDARESFIFFLTQLRNNHDYLPSRLCALSDSELTTITHFHQGSEPNRSVLPSHSRVSARSTSNRTTPHYPTAVERLLSFQRHDPLSALIHTCFANSAGPDSAEDQRRTDIWANACARLIGEKRGEAICISVLNVWTSMRDWSGRSNMEWYLMKILQDGAFLLDRPEDQLGTRFNMADWTPKDQLAAEEFYERATDELFELIDDEDATGLPEGLVELGNQILQRLDSETAHKTRNWLVHKWLFSVWLGDVVMHPETYGLMAEYHITEYGRVKILGAVAQKAQKLVSSLLDPPHTKSAENMSKPLAISPKIRSHVESILDRFTGLEAKRTTPKLLPARSITSLRETVEAHPYLVISPADLVTLVNTLFPERRPPSAYSGGFRSGTASISGFSALSQDISTTMSRNADTPSAFSTSVSSGTSEVTTSHEPLLEDQRTGTSSRYSPPIQDPRRVSNYEEDGFRLRTAVHSLKLALGLDAVRGACHPCAERWAVLFISPDGNQLSPQMKYDPDDEVEEENTSSSDTDDEIEDDRPELDKDYHQLRDSILKLVQDYEIPQNAETEGRKTPTFSNRATSVKKYRNKNKIITAAKTPSHNPYRKPMTVTGSTDVDTGRDKHRGLEDRVDVPHQPNTQPEPPSVLISMLTAASAQSHAQSDFVSAHLYWKTLQQLNTLSSDSLRRNGFATLLNIFSRGPRDSIRRSISAIEEYDAWLVWLKQSQERTDGLIESMAKRLRALRDKMWYVRDVRNSGPYETSRSIAVALKTMGTARMWQSYQKRRRTLARGAAASLLSRTENQVVELLAVTEEQGGPNKLSDEQADLTAEWLRQKGIENFCRGEERIHRFCYEVRKCIKQLTGETMRDGPVLWSSELYQRDRKKFEGSRTPRDRDSHGWDDSASSVSDLDRRFGSAGRASPSAPRGSRAMSSQNVSQQSFDFTRHSYSRSGTAISEAGDGHDFFGASSPVPTIDTAVTYWSPFEAATSPSSTVSRAHSPTTSITNLSSLYALPKQYAPQSYPHSTGRPGTSASSETIYQQRLSDEKTRFLSELKQTLTSLLLSDLGSLVFARGSETDGWFSDLGQDCIDRRRAQRALAREKPREKPPKANRNSLKQRVIEKKRSFGDLRGANSDPASPTGSLDPPSSRGNDSSATSDTLSARSPSLRKDTTPEFPFKKAYHRLLKTFCVHPNPIAKLSALSELEHLIVASLTAGGGRRKLPWIARDAGSPTPSEDQGIGTAVRAKALEEAIDNVKERRSLAMAQPASFTCPVSPSRPGGMNAETRSVMSINPANTDAICNVLKTLFRDAGIRPKTLFRDLQFIASFVSPEVLDKPDRGKAFWNTGLAALGLKKEVIRTMVLLADEIVVHDSQKRKNNPSASTASAAAASTSAGVPSPAPPPPPAAFTLADAARMWTITAKEGDPTSQRELALFYLSSPELVVRTTLPLSRPRGVFKQDIMAKYQTSAGGPAGGSSGYHHHPHGGLAAGGGAAGTDGGGGLKVGDVRSDPSLMCVAIHWMQAADQGGDEVAGDFLAQHGISGKA